MGCLNSTGQFEHWFGNIHLSGPCNRACYFCIGQHMMELDKYNNLDKWPLEGFNEFVEQCNAKNIKEVNLTGSNTDPLLYKHINVLNASLRLEIPWVKIGIRTNGVVAWKKPGILRLFDKVSFSIPSFDYTIYRKIMGYGQPPDIAMILERYRGEKKANIVLSPFSAGNDLNTTIHIFSMRGVTKINLREPYGQPRVGDPFKSREVPLRYTYGMPTYAIKGAEVTYWDVHHVEVESVNLYANGNVSLTYPITKGYIPGDGGEVKDQSHWKEHKRHNPQWINHKANG